MGAQQCPQAGSEVRGHKFLKFTGEKNPKNHKNNATNPTLDLLPVSEMRTLYCKIVWPVLLHVLSACAVPSVPARAFLSRAVPPAPGTRCPGHSAASRATWGAAGGRDQAVSVLLGALGGTGMLLSLVISLESQRLLVKAVTCPGTELPSCFQRQKRTCALSPSSNPASPSFPRGKQGWSVCNAMAPVFQGWQ